MKKAAPLLVAALLTLAGIAPARAAILVELFTAQGCASCGVADALMGKLAERPDVIPLTWSVDYWDYLGWKDTFAKPAFTDRQRAYNRRFGLQDVYTPQVVVSGAVQTSGGSAADVKALVEKALRQKVQGPRIRILADGRVTVGPGDRRAGTFEVWLIRYRPKEQDVVITDGDNRGKTVANFNVVRDVTRLGVWRGSAASFKAPPSGEEGLAGLVVVQGIRGGRVVALARLAD